MTLPQGDYDSPWKEALDTYLPDFLALCAPWIYEAIQWSRGFESLEQELIQVTRDAEVGRRLADKLVRVWLLDGQDVWVLIHIEVQAQEDADFAERMFVYFYRIYDQYRRRVVSLAVLADERATWRPAQFSLALLRCENHFQFPIVKLLDWKDRRDALRASGNLFASVLLAHLAAQETRGDVEERRIVKYALVRALYVRGFSRDQILNLFRFIDWMLALPEAAARLFRADIMSLEEELHMPYITSIERMGIERGIEQGIEQGIERGIEQGIERGIEQGIERGIEQGIEQGVEVGRHAGKLDAIRHIARVRFGAVPNALEQQLSSADDAAIDALLDRAISAKTIEEL